MAYEKRVIVFIDILGFKEEIKSTLGIDGVPDNKRIDIVEKTLYKISNALKPREEWERGLGGYENPNSSVVTQFSDSIVASIRLDDPAEVFEYIIRSIYFIPRILINDAGLTCRGGVGIGFVRHTETTLFGPAITQAYEIESSVAKYPRIIIHPEVYSMLHGVEERIQSLEALKLEDVISVDCDGLYFINYFKNLPILDDDSFWNEYYSKLQKVIRDGLLNPNLGIASKYMWMLSKIPRI